MKKKSDGRPCPRQTTWTRASLIPTDIPRASRAAGTSQIPISRQGVRLGAVAYQKAKDLPYKNRRYFVCHYVCGLPGRGCDACLNCFNIGPSRR